MTRLTPWVYSARFPAMLKSPVGVCPSGYRLTNWVYCSGEYGRPSSSVLGRMPISLHHVSLCGSVKLA